MSISEKELVHALLKYISSLKMKYPFICRWTSRLFPCPGYYKQCCDEHWGTCVSFNSGFSQIYTQEWNCQDMQQLYFQLLEKLPYCFPYWLHQSTFPQCRRVPFTSHPHQHLSLVFSLIIASLAGVMWYLTVVLIKKSAILSFCHLCNMDGLESLNVKVREKQIMCDATYIWNVKNMPNQ